MRKQYLHLSAYSCDKCAGPVIAGSLECERMKISKETEIRQVEQCACPAVHRQDEATEPARARHLSPLEWEFVTRSMPVRLRSMKAIQGSRTQRRSIVQNPIEP